MKKFVKLTSLVLALVLAIGASAIPAFAATDDCKLCKQIAETGDLSLNYNWSYKSDGVGHDIVTTAIWCHPCFKGPIIFGIEEKRDAAIQRLQKGYYTAVYYMDEIKHLYTDMPKYGGVLLARYGTPEWNELMYGPYVNANDTSGKFIEKKTTYHDAILYSNTISKMTLTADTTSFGFADVSDTVWYATPVNALANAGILKGVGNNKFAPDEIITWQQMYWILERLLGINGEYIPTSTDDMNIQQVVGAVMGWSDLALPANDKTPVTRAEAFSIIATLYSLRADNYEAGKAYHAATGDGKGVWANSALAGLAQNAVVNGAKEWKLTDIPDYQALLDMYYDYDHDFNLASLSATPYDSIYATVATGTNVIDIPNILRAYTLGLVKGSDGKGTMNPAGKLTRAQFCQLLYNAGIFGCIYPHINTLCCAGNGSMGNLNTYALQQYMQTHATDGTPVNPDGTVKS